MCGELQQPLVHLCNCESRRAKQGILSGEGQGWEKSNFLSGKILQICHFKELLFAMALCNDYLI